MEAGIVAAGVLVYVAIGLLVARTLYSGAVKDYTPQEMERASDFAAAFSGFLGLVWPVVVAAGLTLSIVRIVLLVAYRITVRAVKGK